MIFKDIPIRSKLTRVMMLVSGIVLLVTCISFFIYEFYSFRQETVQKLSTLGKIISTNSSAALAFDNQQDAGEILNALKAEPHIVAASLYDKRGKLFSTYVSNSATINFPTQPQNEGYHFVNSYLEGFQPVVQGDRRLGTLYLKSDLKAMYETFQLYGFIVILVIALSFLLAYSLSLILQKGISKPILALAETATAISQRKDYSVRAYKISNDELGVLTDAFNQMLNQIQEQNYALSEFNQKLEQKVIERTTELEAANKELESFSYSVSHDLRAPLRAINGYINIFAEEYTNRLDEEGKRLIDNVIGNSKKMGMLIDDLLAFARLGRKEMVKTNFSMKDLVFVIWNEMSRLETARNIEFTLAELPDICADKTTIQQVWTNLISNALKYTRNKEKAIIEISFEEKEKEITYYIKDNGAGFDMEYYNKLFGVFQRLHSQQEFEGTGVGLAIIHRIIEKHEGKIWAYSKVDEGATFYFTLPK